MKNYTLHRTDSDAPTITVDKMTINSDSVDVSLPGRIRLEYGQEVDEALLNILENFSCPNANNASNVPDLTKTSNEQLHNPTVGQLWFNPLTRRIYSWNGTKWDGYGLRDDYAANWGMIMHGQQLPRPVSAATGRVFDYDECIWTVAPSTFLGKIGYMACSTDPDANVTMRYRYAGTSNMMDGQANYLIISLPGGKKRGPYPTPPLPSPTATMTPTPTLTPTPTVSITMTPTMSMTPTPTMSATPTPTPPPSFSPTPIPSQTPSVTPTPAPSQTPAPSPIPPNKYEWVFTSSWSGQENFTCREGEMDSGQAMDYTTQYFLENPCNAERLGQYFQVNWCDPGGPTSIGFWGYDCMIVD